MHLADVLWDTLATAVLDWYHTGMFSIEMAFVYCCALVCRSIELIAEHDWMIHCAMLCNIVHALHDNIITER